MKITVVTPTFNRRAFLERTGRSILSQAGDFELEWLVIDGGSTDGTPDWLAATASGDPRVRFVSESDRGQSHAINKGFAAATGDVVSWLNADDEYPPAALAAVADAFRSRAGAQWIVGRYEVIDADDRPIRQAIVRYKRRRLERFSYRALLAENIIPQPAVFWRADFGRQIGPLDESLHWTMDYDLWLRMARSADPVVIDALLARFRHHAASKSGDFNRRQFDEGYAVAQRHAHGDRMGLVRHRLNVEKIVWAYRGMRLLGW